ncbi:MAG: hypothetical protein IPP47_19040 [Bryobacterales bacterium]|nr:hypothetical protein [Bryobacterales bacterium]
MAITPISLVGGRQALKPLDSAAASPLALSDELRYRVLDASAARDKRSGRGVIWALASWSIAFFLILAWAISKFAT